MPKRNPTEDLQAVRIVRAFKPGDVVFLECTRPMNQDSMQHLHREFKRLCPEVKIIVLQAGVRVVGKEEAPVSP